MGDGKMQWVGPSGSLTLSLSHTSSSVFGGVFRSLEEVILEVLLDQKELECKSAQRRLCEMCIIISSRVFNFEMETTSSCQPLHSLLPPIGALFCQFFF